jgi:hypothetical protein
MSRRKAALVRTAVVAAVAVTPAVVALAPAVAGGRGSAFVPTTVAVVSGQLLAVAQDAGSVGWLEAGPAGCLFRVRPLAGGPTRSLRYARGCLPVEHDLVLAGRRAAWGGFEEVRCSDTHAAVYGTAGSAARLVQEVPGDCLGYGTSYQGLATDGTSFFYSLLATRPKPLSSRCGEGGPCRWQLAGGRVVRIAGSRPATVRGLPPAALIAGSPGRVALVQPAPAASSNGRGAVDWPRVATDGKVEVRETRRGRLVSSFSPRGTVRAVALSSTRAAVLIEAAGRTELAWYDADSGAHLRTVVVPRSTARRLSTDGRFVALAVGKTIWIVDLKTGAQRVAIRRAVTAVGLSVEAGRLVWGENGRQAGRILAVRL